MTTITIKKTITVKDGKIELGVSELEDGIEVDVEASLTPKGEKKNTFASFVQTALAIGLTGLPTDYSETHKQRKVVE